jgi:hypothetical protein
MKDWQWGVMMMILCNIAYHVNDEASILPLIIAPLFLIAGFFLSFKRGDF